MAMTEAQWARGVRAAAMAGDSAQLTRLFAVAHELFGEQAGQMWARTLSALDGTAVTG